MTDITLMIFCEFAAKVERTYIKAKRAYEYELYDMVVTSNIPDTHSFQNIGDCYEHIKNTLEKIESLNESLRKMQEQKRLRTEIMEARPTQQLDILKELQERLESLQ